MNHDSLTMLAMVTVVPAALLVVAGCGWRKLAIALAIAFGGALCGAVAFAFFGGIFGKATDTSSGEWRGIGTLAFGVVGAGVGVLVGFGATITWLVRRGKFDTRREAPQPVLLGLAVIAAVPMGLAYLSAGQEETARITLPSPVRCVAIDPAGALVASGGENGAVRLWNAADLSPRGELPNNSSSMVLALTFSPDGKVLAVSRHGRGRIELWNVADGEFYLTATLTDAPFSDSTLAFSADGKLLGAGGTDNPTRLYELRDGSPRLSVSNFTHGSRALVFSPDSRALITDDTEKLVVWDLAQPLPQPRHTITAAPNKFRSSPSLAISADGALLAVSGENFPNLVRLWDLRGKEPAERTGFPDRCTEIALSADGQFIATASYEMAMYPSKEKAGPRVRLWALGGAAPVQHASVPAHVPVQFDGAAVSTVAMSADGKTLVSGGHDRTVRAWDIADGNLVERAKALNEPTVKKN